MKKRFVSMALSIAMVLAMAVVPASAADANDGLKEGISPIVDKVSEFLDNSSTTQTIVVSEQEFIDQMLASKTVTREDLNADLAEKASRSEDSLKQDGYNEEQISIITSYQEKDDAYNHIFVENGRSASNSKLTFRYGLAGNNTRRDITIAYDIMWTTCPFWTFTDSFGVGWIAADSMSKKIMTKIDSCMAVVQYYDHNEEHAYLYRDVEMNDFSNCVIIGNPIMGSANGNYGKHIGGVTEISTQSGSYNIDTIQLFVAYAHTLMSISFNWEVSLGFDISDYGISFSPSIHVTQEIMTQDKHTFKYNSQDCIIA